MGCAEPTASRPWRCGSASNGDNLLAIHDGDVATVFAIEALSLVAERNTAVQLAFSGGGSGSRGGAGAYAPSPPR